MQYAISAIIITMVIAISLSSGWEKYLEYLANKDRLNRNDEETKSYTDSKVSPVQSDGTGGDGI